MQIEAQLGIEGTGLANQQQAEMQADPAEKTNIASSKLQPQASQNDDAEPSLIQDVAQQTDHDLQQNVKSQRQENSEL